MPRVAALLLVPLLFAAALAPTAAAAQTAPCVPPRMAVNVLMTGGAYTTVPRRPVLRCLSRRDFDGMRRARAMWRCVGPSGARPASCTAINVPAAPPHR